jgi:hypothetical protein
MSKKTGKMMSNIPRHYINSMDELQQENDILTTKIKELEIQGIVEKGIAKQYAEFCVRCDREGLPLLELDDYINDTGKNQII